MSKLKAQRQYEGKNRGQVVLEYFLIFAMVAILTIIGLTNFHEQVADAWKSFFNAAARKMVQP